jgi:hypothetical protein
LDIPIKVDWGSASDIEVTFPNNVTEGMQLVYIRGNQYRVETSSVLAEPSVFYGDIIEIIPTAQTAAVFQSIVRRSEFKVFDFIISPKIADSPQLQALLESIMQLGGNWERFFGGVLLVHLPRGVELDIDAKLQELARDL